MTEQSNQRILLVDDTPTIHEDFKKILTPDSGGSATLASARAAFFGTAEEDQDGTRFELESAFQGQEALERVQAAIDEGRPYAMAFVDVRMPPGWDGVQTIRELWKVDPLLQCVICTAYTDYSWEQTVDALGETDRLLILKKPFDPIEIRQLASALTGKWNSAARERRAIEEIAAKEAEARAYASSLETLNKALSTSKASADRASEMKSDFLLHLTTEVDKHLTSIVDELIRSGQTDQFESALDQARGLIEMINKVMDFTGLETGNFAIESGTCAIDEVLREIESTQAPVAEAKGLTLKLAVRGHVPDRIQGDQKRLKQVLTHLVENAVRYTHEGGVQLVVSTEPTEDWERARLRFDVVDTGPGIDPERAGRVFEPFACRDRKEMAKGSGLSLAVAKQVTRLMGGDLQFVSNLGAGSTFTLVLESKNIPDAGTLAVPGS